MTRINEPADQDGGRTFYCLDFFPYPSGYGLSVGHGRNYVPTDVISRYHRMRGDAVLRTYGVGAQILRDLGLSKIRVLSAPKQMHAISGFDLEITEYV